MSYTVFVPCAGLGTRMGGLTRHLNKALVAVAGKPAISRVIDQFPADARFIVALGYKGDVLREFLELAYPSRDIICVNVSPYEGDGSGLGYTLLCAEPWLRQPFVFCSCDTLVAGQVPPPDANWAGWSAVDELDSYRTLDVAAGGKASRINAKRAHGADSKAYIGLAGIRHWEGFWRAMQAGGDVAVAEGEAFGLADMAQSGELGAIEFEWTDIGTESKLIAAEARFEPEVHATILPKETEAIWFVDGQVVKFSTDVEFIRNRVRRAEALAGFVPPLSGHTAHMYAYRRVEGQVLSETVTLPRFQRLLDHCKDFWRPEVLDPDTATTFRDKCLKFYRDKTFERLDMFYRRFGHADGDLVINGRPTPPVRDLLAALPWDKLANGLPGRFHGDFHFENILLTSTEDFVFLDWRQDFCGDLTCGDIYYDLAKLLHGLIVNHEIIAAENYSASWDGERLDFDFHRRQRLVECERLLFRHLREQGFDGHKVAILTGLVFLNIAALHHHPYCLLLYGLGAEIIHKEIVDDDRH